MKLYLTQRLTKINCEECSSFRLISFKKLSKNDVSLAREFKIRRYYLPALNEAAAHDFQQEFGDFWGNLIEGYSHESLFWRNAISSKMQAWSNSIGYLCLVLFTLTRIRENENISLIILCNSPAMQKVCAQWAKTHEWSLLKKDINTAWHEVLSQKVIDATWFLIQFLRHVLKKIRATGIKNDFRIENKAVLIPSLFYSHSFRNNSYNDPFFGNLHEYINDKGFQCVYVCEPLNELNRSTLKRASQCTSAAIHTPYTLLSWKKFLAVFLTLCFRKIMFLQSTFMGCDVSSYLSWYANSFRYPFSIQAELYFKSVTYLCSIYNFDRLILNFEGNVYERACIQAFRKINSGRVIGYSHAVIYPLNLKVALTEKEALLKPRPDYYICTGSYTKELLKKAGQGYMSSDLRDGCILKDVPEIKLRTNSVQNNNILLALDGVETTLVLLDWILEHAGKLKGFTFILRFHPNISKQSILNQSIHPFPDNVRISDIDLGEDIENSFCVLYRHSSVGLQAILNGIPAIHVQVDSPLCGDPLRELNDYKWSVHSVSELSDVIQELQSLKPEQKKRLLDKAIVFAKNYFAPRNEEAINDFIN